MFATKKTLLIVFRTIILMLLGPSLFNLSASDKKLCHITIKDIIKAERSEMMALDKSSDLPPLPPAVKEIYPPVPPYQKFFLDKKFKGEEKALKASKIYQSKLRYGVSYLNPEERVEHLVRYGNNGRLYDYQGKLVDTSFSLSYDLDRKKQGSTLAIFVLSPSGHLYLSKISEAGIFHHSSFLSGGEVIFAGEIKVIAGKIISFSNASGHYKTPSSAHQNFLKFLNSIWGEKTPKIEFKEFHHLPSQKY